METKKPHAVCIPFPLQSHLKAILKFSKLLYHSGFHITFVNTEFNHNRFLKSRGPDSLTGSDNFRFATVPDGLPPSDVNSSQNIPALIASVSKNFLDPFRDLVAKINETACGHVPPVSCIVADGMMPFAYTVAEELGIPHVQVWTVAACVFQRCTQLPTVTENVVKDAGYYTDNLLLYTKIEETPDMEEIPKRDVPSSYGRTDPVIKLVIESLEIAPRAVAIVIHTYDALEKDVLDDISSMFSHVYAIGPFQLLLDRIQDPLMAIGYNLWEEQTECLQWLNSREPNSVVYVNFGSIAVLSPEQLLDFGWGLANSKYSFLWIIRPDLVIGASEILPQQFLVESKERGMVASWCPQEAVLKHPSIGGFITHCGWGSTIESLSAGVPMLCWPFVADQPINCRFICNEWGVGMEIDKNVKRDELEKFVRELMEGEKGKEMKEKALEWKSMAYEATSPNGSSSVNLEKLVNKLLNSTQK